MRAFAVLIGMLAAFCLNCAKTEAEKTCEDICAPKEVLFVAEEEPEKVNLCACWNSEAFADEAEKLTGAKCEAVCDPRGGVRAFGSLVSACLCQP